MVGRVLFCRWVFPVLERERDLRGGEGKLSSLYIISLVSIPIVGLGRIIFSGFGFIGERVGDLMGDLAGDRVGVVGLGIVDGD